MFGIYLLSVIIIAYFLFRKRSVLSKDSVKSQIEDANSASETFKKMQD